MIAATIHLNGTSAGELKRQHAEAADALSGALTALLACAPHGRDFYTQGSGAYTLAAHYHRLAVTQLSAIHEQVVDVINQLHEQMMPRA